MGENLHNWAFGQASISEAADSFMCNGDSMIHSLKGVIGLRIDGVEDVSVSNLKIENLYEYAELGSELCGEYDHSHFTQRLPFQTGYSGNMMQGISVDYANAIFKDVEILNLESATGMAVGINLWYGADVQFEDSVKMEGIYAGSSIEDKSKYSYFDRPNKAPESCFVRIVDLLDETVEIEQSVTLAKDGISSLLADATDELHAVFDLQCIEGAIGCNGESLNSVKSNIGSYNGCSNRDQAKVGLLSYLSLDNMFVRVTNDSKVDVTIVIVACVVILIGVWSVLRKAGYLKIDEICKRKKKLFGNEMIDDLDDINAVEDRDNHYGSMTF